jgi:hypothetical protein
MYKRDTQIVLVAFGFAVVLKHLTSEQGKQRSIAFSNIPELSD